MWERIDRAETDIVGFTRRIQQLISEIWLDTLTVVASIREEDWETLIDCLSNLKRNTDLLAAAAQSLGRAAVKMRDALEGAGLHKKSKLPS